MEIWPLAAGLIMKNMTTSFRRKSVRLKIDIGTYFDKYLDFGIRVETFGTCVQSGRNSEVSDFRNSQLVLFT